MRLQSYLPHEGPSLDTPIEPRLILPALAERVDGSILKLRPLGEWRRDDPEWQEVRSLALRVELGFSYHREALMIEFGLEREMVSVHWPHYGPPELLDVCDPDFFEGTARRRRVLQLALILAVTWRWLPPRAWDWRAMVAAPPKVGPARRRRPGFVRFELTGQDRISVDTWIMRERARGDGYIKPLRAKSVDHVVEKLANPSEGDLEAMRRLAYVSVWDHVRGYETRAMSEARLAALADFIAALRDVTEVTFNGRPLTVLSKPWPFKLCLHDGDAGEIRLRWLVEPAAIWPLGQGWVLDDVDQLWAIPEGVLDRFPGGLPLDLPTVFPDEIEAFLNDWLAHTELPVSFESERIEAPQRTPTPRVLIAAEGEALHLSAGFRYGSVDVDADGSELVVEAGRVGRRDGDAEAALVNELSRVVGQAVPCALEGDAGYDFLFEGLPSLEGWLIEADRALAQVRRGRFTPKVKLESGADWFGLDVAFELDGQRLSTRRLLAAWRQRRRYVRLDDGSVARLPDAWLGQHGEAVDDLAALQRRDKKLRAPAALGLEGLIAQAGEAGARWLDLAKRVREFQLHPLPTPKGLTAQLRRYQLDGFRWMAALTDVGLGAVLADDMGLGKTVQTLALLLHRRAQGAALVVAPTSVVWNWRDEAARFAPSLRVHVHHGAGRGTPPTDVDVVVTSYALLRRDTVLAERTWGTAVLDEAQHIKTPTTAVAKAARALQSEARIALTGTPLENHLGELWSLFEYAVPGVFGSAEVFRARYANPIQQGEDEAALAQLRARIRPFVLRRLKSEVATELPPIQEQVLYVDLPRAQRRLYDDLRDAYRDSVLAAVEAKGPKGASIEVLEALMRLRQACCHPGLVPLPQAKGLRTSAKLDRLLEVLDEVIGEGHRSLVFSQWPSLLKFVREALDARGWPYLYLDGSTTKRAHLQAQWNDPAGPPVFLISIKAGGSGLNLVGADHVIHLDPWWNPAVEQQATDRAHRIGQTKPVIVYKIVARDTAEEQILDIQARKRALFEATLDAERMGSVALTAAELDAIFRGASPPRALDAPSAVPLVEGPPVEPVHDDGPPPPAVVGDADDDGWANIAGLTGPLSNSDIRAHLGCTPSRALRLLQRWVAEGRLHRTGKARGTRYTVVAPG